jgi:hypothetical protein
VSVSPRWGITPDVREAYAVARYAPGDGYVAYRWRQGANAIELEVTGSADVTRIALPLPRGAGEGRRSRLEVTRNGAPAPYTIEERLDGRYVLLDSPDVVVQVRVSW